RPFLDVSLVDVLINTATLTTPGTYLGQIRILADADNSPQSVTVAVTVLPAGGRAPLEVRPSGLIFTGLQGSNPSSQTVQFAPAKRERPSEFPSEAGIRALTWCRPWTENGAAPGHPEPPVRPPGLL